MTASCLSVQGLHVCTVGPDLKLRMVRSGITWIISTSGRPKNIILQLGWEAESSQPLIISWCFNSMLLMGLLSVFLLQYLDFRSPYNSALKKFLCRFFMHTLFSHQWNLSLKIKKFHFFTSQHVSAAKGEHHLYIRCLVMIKLSHCIRYIKCLFIHTMCKCDVSCLLYSMYTRFLFGLIKFIHFII
jgi:hypothetical protein